MKHWTTIDMGYLYESNYYGSLGVCKALKLSFGSNVLLWPFPIQGPSGLETLFEFSSDSVEKQDEEGAGQLINS